MSDQVSSRIKGMPAVSIGDRSAGLPRNYGETKIVILPRDPLWLYAYWEIAPDMFSSLRGKLGEAKFNASRWVLRVHDVTGIKFDGSNANRFFDMEVSAGSDNWYVNVSDVNRAWCVDLGLRTPEGDFILVTRSNILSMPRQGVSPITDEQWAILQMEFERLLKMSGVDQIGKSSFAVARLMRERWEEIVSISLPGSHGFGGASSWKTAPSSASESPAKTKDFWLKADTELIVYGATEADASLTVQGQKVTLRPDGSFSLRFYLPDGEQTYPIEATSADGTMKRHITFVVRRDTK